MDMSVSISQGLCRSSFMMKKELIILSRAAETFQVV